MTRRNYRMIKTFTVDNGKDNRACGLVKVFQMLITVLQTDLYIYGKIIKTRIAENKMGSVGNPSQNYGW